VPRRFLDTPAPARRSVLRRPKIYKIRLYSPAASRPNSRGKVHKIKPTLERRWHQKQHWQHEVHQRSPAGSASAAVVQGVRGGHSWRLLPVTEPPWPCWQWSLRAPSAPAAAPARHTRPEMRACVCIAAVHRPPSARRAACPAGRRLPAGQPAGLPTRPPACLPACLPRWWLASQEGSGVSRTSRGPPRGHQTCIDIDGSKTCGSERPVLTGS
jgi:hypothetical protein